MGFDERHSRIRACARPHLMFAPDSKSSHLMDNYAREKTSAVQRRETKKKKKAQDEARAFRLCS